MNIDWKDALGQLRDSVPEDNTPDLPATGSQHPAKQSLGNIHVALEKKGRKGKTATIIYGFTCDDDELQRIASELKKKIGTGGSARGGEILLQGDWQKQALDFFKSRK